MLIFMLILFFFVYLPADSVVRIWLTCWSGLFVCLFVSTHSTAGNSTVIFTRLDRQVARVFTSPTAPAHYLVTNSPYPYLQIALCFVWRETSFTYLFILMLHFVDSARGNVGAERRLSLCRKLVPDTSAGDRSGYRQR